jgi:hypothetical protein
MQLSVYLLQVILSDDEDVPSFGRYFFSHQCNFYVINLSRPDDVIDFLKRSQGRNKDDAYIPKWTILKYTALFQICFLKEAAVLWSSWTERRVRVKFSAYSRPLSFTGW